MSYHIIQPKNNLRHVPNIKVDYIKLRPSEICLKKSGRIPNLQVLELSPDKEVVFYPFIMTSFFCVNAQIKEILVSREKFIVTKQLVLIEPITNKTEQYFMIILDEIGCLLKNKKLDIGDLAINTAIVNRSVFKVIVYDRSYIVVDGKTKEMLEGLENHLDFLQLKEGSA